MTANRKAYLWSGLMLLLMLSVFTPLGVLTTTFLMVPVLAVYMLTPPRVFALCMLIVYGVLSLIGGWPLILIAFFFTIPAVVMGILYKQGRPVGMAILGGILAFIVQLLCIMIGFALAGTDVGASMEQFLRDSLETVPETLREGIPEEFYDQAVQWMVRMLPFYMIAFAFYFVVITHAVTRRVLKNSEPAIPAMKPLKTWRLPKSLAWYYIAALVLQWFVDPASDSIVVVILFNLLPILTFAFCIQALGFLFFVASLRRWGRILPIVGVPAAIFFSNLMGLLGLFDILFDLRGSLKKKYSGSE